MRTSWTDIVLVPINIKPDFESLQPDEVAVTFDRTASVIYDHHNRGLAQCTLTDSAHRSFAAFCKELAKHACSAQDAYPDDIKGAIIKTQVCENLMWNSV